MEVRDGIDGSKVGGSIGIAVTNEPKQAARFGVGMLLVELSWQGMAKLLQHNLHTSTESANKSLLMTSYGCIHGFTKKQVKDKWFCYNRLISNSLIGVISAKAKL